MTKNHIDEAGVDYDYRGDAKRHERVGGGTKRFSWDSDWGNVSEENGSGTLERMYVGNMAHVDGTNPASGAYTYYLQDHLGSTRYVYDQSKNLVGEFEYTPYGGSYLDGGPADVTARFTGHRWDSRSGLYFAPYRYYSPAAGRWISRDPLGMVDGTNVYGYVGGRPLSSIDLLGLLLQDPRPEDSYSCNKNTKYSCATCCDHMKKKWLEKCNQRKGWWSRLACRKKNDACSTLCALDCDSETTTGRQARFAYNGCMGDPGDSTQPYPPGENWDDPGFEPTPPRSCLR